MKSSFIRISIVFLILILSNCARRGRPTGGDKDEVAPIMITSKPAFETTHFNSKSIQIYFDEYIKLDKIGQQLIVSPPLKYKPIITPLGSASKTLNIKILDTLQKETTYIFNFGTSVRDNNEGNILYNFKYVMSTGGYIDSLNLKGTIKDALSNVVDKDVAILLYRMDEKFNDSIIYKGLPNYIANTLDTVTWELTNLKEGKYKLVALKQKNYDYKFKPASDKIAFYPDTINIPRDSSFNLALFKEILDYKLARPSEVTKQHIVFGYNGIAKDIKIELLSQVTDSFKSIQAFESDKDTLNYWFNTPNLDSLQFKVSNKEAIDTVMVKLRAQKFDSLVVGSLNKSVLNFNDDFKLLSNQPITKVDDSKIILMDKDSVKTPFKTVISELKTQLHFKFEKEPNKAYRLMLLPNAIQTFFESNTDTIRYLFGTKKITELGSVFLSFAHVKSYPIIVELTDLKTKVIQSRYLEKPQEVSFLNIDPEKYLIRVIYDENKNSVWDTGNFLKHINPEEVIYFKNELDVRANWEITEVFDLAK
ncbi:MAG: hypothetical protein COZ76_00315 [Flavobacteriales bacterium CG_4_8_14_3_um_filter_35_10]|nr:Ig-like domain-containing protein [Zetaproteobacteria bacterium]OIO08642.1 MAG: hypothetical protein AUJ53_11315 [Flavobacteriaceae bacterium CG1_02_35_72]PIX08025.1 MAG: hypothetical protein COZ76_00315 [Flavobacteriales bacterium CG_4_8_14_3_um_filter_35_10]PJA06691.1 MAG: hypothetical protein COX71_01535 [Flavobacteriales bacterium CG_4_10_14_0_2_um_filter_35_18]